MPTGSDAPLPPVPSVILSLAPAGAAFQGEVEVSISADVTGSQIRYTTDGTAPTATSTLYSAPLLLSSTTQLRARAFAEGVASSEGVGGVYIARDFDATSDLPLVIVDGYGAGKPEDKQVYKDAAVLAFEPADGEAALSAVPTTVSRAGYHVRGQSSAGFPQTPYKVELWDEQNEDRDLPLVGLPEESDWALIGPFSDRSLIRNALIYDVGREMGLQAPRYAFVELYLNFEPRALSAADYQGIYMVVETIKNAKRRLNLKELEEDDVSDELIAGGYIFKFDQLAAEEPTLPCTGSDPVVGTFGGPACPEDTAGLFPPTPKGCNLDPDAGAPGATFGGGFGGGFAGGDPVEPEPEPMCWADLEVVDPTPLAEAQKTWLTTYVSNLNTALHEEPIGPYGDYIDVASFVDTFLLNEFSRNMDAYARSVYFYKDRDTKVIAGPLWDFNLTFAVGGYFCNDNPVGWQYDQRMGTNDWFHELAADPAFMALAATRWKELRQGVLSQAALEERILELSAPLANAVERDFERWPVCSVADNLFVVPEGETWEEQLQVVRDFLNLRGEWLDTQLQ